MKASKTFGMTSFSTNRRNSTLSKEGSIFAISVRTLDTSFWPAENEKIGIYLENIFLFFDVIEFFSMKETIRRVI